MGHHYVYMIYGYRDVCRYQPGSLNSSEKPVELQTLTEGEYVCELEKKPVNETFSLKHLLLPGSESPTKISGLIVYITTAVTCKSPFTDKLCLSAAQTLCVYYQLEKFLIFLLWGGLTLTLRFVTQGSQDCV